MQKKFLNLIILLGLFNVANAQGNVGIGTSSPTQKLDVVGNIKSSGLAGTGLRMVVADSTGTMSTQAIPATAATASNGLTATSGDVTLGGTLTTTTTIVNDGFDLNISGTGKFTTTSDALINDISVGKGAGNLANNTALGTDALSSNTTGNYNSATGYQALYYNATGYENSATGYQALYANTMGNRNSATGFQALYSNTSGGNNSAMGFYALYFNTSGFNNSALGYQALYSNTTGVGNSATGSHALYFNTSGNYNSAKGLSALYFNTTGSNNSAMGYYALYFNTTGSNNSATGREALYSNTTGFSNTSVGTGSLYANTVGYRNTAIGDSADVTLNNLTNATAIGYNAKVGASNSLVLGNGANVGIGTSTPTQKLEVVGNIKSSSLAGTGLRMVVADATGIMSTQAIPSGAGATASNGLTATAGNVTLGGTLTAATTIANAGFNLNITGTGNVGIGTYTPTAQLVVVDHTGTPVMRGIWSEQHSNNINGVIIGGRKSRGTETAPTAVMVNDYGLVHVAQNYDGSSYLVNGSLGYRITGTPSIGNIQGEWFIAASNLNDTNPYANNTVRMVVQSSGNVGIGTSAPSEKLEVVGNIKSSSLAGTGLRMVVADATGTMNTQAIPSGIATASNGLTATAGDVTLGGTLTAATTIVNAGFDLNITGNGKLTTTSDALINDITVGKGAGNVASNTALGTNALNFNTVGGGNSATGYQALAYNTTGFNNSATGYHALYYNTTGGNNSAMGLYALHNNTTGSGNSGMGVAALNLNTTGTNNSATGYHALYSNTTGFGNSATGSEALFYNTTGYFNSAMGYAALFYNTTGSYNSATGYEALFYNTTGEGNSAIGYLALAYNTTGFSNTSVGTKSLLTNEIGYRNTAIGDSADVTVGNLTNATAIGYNAKVDASNKVAIGNTAVTSISGQVGWSTYSDKRLKKNVEEATLGLDFIMKLHPVTYEYIAEGQKGIRYTGLIAQEVDEAAKGNFSAVDKNGEYWGIRYAELTVPLIKAMQEMQKENEALKAKNEALTAKAEKTAADLNDLKAQVEKLNNATLGNSSK